MLETDNNNNPQCRRFVRKSGENQSLNPDTDAIPRLASLVARAELAPNPFFGRKGRMETWTAGHNISYAFRQVIFMVILIILS